MLFTHYNTTYGKMRSLNMYTYFLFYKHFTPSVLFYTLNLLTLAFSLYSKYIDAVFWKIYCVYFFFNIYFMIRSWQMAIVFYKLKKNIVLNCLILKPEKHNLWVVNKNIFLKYISNPNIYK